MEIVFLKMRQEHVYREYSNILCRIKVLLPDLKVFICVFVCVTMMEIVKF